LTMRWALVKRNRKRAVVKVGGEGEDNFGREGAKQLQSRGGKKGGFTKGGVGNTGGTRSLRPGEKGDQEGEATEGAGGKRGREIEKRRTKKEKELSD